MLHIYPVDFYNWHLEMYGNKFLNTTVETWLKSMYNSFGDYTRHNRFVGMMILYHMSDQKDVIYVNNDIIYKVFETVKRRKT